MNDSAMALFNLLWGHQTDRRIDGARVLQGAIRDVTEAVVLLLAECAHQSGREHLTLPNAALIDRAGEALRHLSGLSVELDRSIHTRLPALQTTAAPPAVEDRRA